MKIKFKHRDEKIKKLKKWHKKFIFFPKKINDNELHFMCYVKRRLKLMWPGYEYKVLK